MVEYLPAWGFVRRRNLSGLVAEKIFRGESNSFLSSSIDGSWAGRDFCMNLWYHDREISEVQISKLNVDKLGESGKNQIDNG